MSPSKDTYQQKHPETNKWLGDEHVASPEVSALVRRPEKEQRRMSGQILRLAKRLRRDPDELAAEIPDDTLRRTKFPVIEEVGEDGRRTFRKDPQIIEGPRSLTQK
jgi:hypothetical protein